MGAFGLKTGGWLHLALAKRLTFGENTCLIYQKTLILEVNGSV
jgi:hypothetical protein